MKKVLSWVTVLGLSVVEVLTACGDAGRSRWREGPNEDGGAPDGGVVGVAGTLSASGGAGGEPSEPNGGTGSDAGGSSAEGGTLTSGGTSGPGPETAGSEQGPQGGTTASAGTGAIDPGSGGTDTESGGTGSGATGSGGDASAGTGTVGVGGGGGVEGEGSGGAGAGVGIGGEGGGSGSEPPAECGDGVLAPGESCCTAAWVDANITLASALANVLLVGTTGCIARAEQAGLAICSSAACDGGATGCRTEVTAATLEYSPDTQEIAGTASVVIQGRMSARGLGSCGFRATIDELRYRAHVIREITPAAVHLSLAEPDIEDYTLRVEGCFGIGGAAELLLNTSLAREAIEAPIRALLLDRFELDQACPY